MTTQAAGVDNNPPAPAIACTKDPENGAQHNQEGQLTGWRLYLLAVAFGMANVMMALDASVLGPALPAITSDFRTIDNIGWYSSTYLLAQMSFQPLFGRLLLSYEPKLFYILSLGVFEVGSIVCATAQTSPVFILARAVAGCGAAGIMTGSLAVFGQEAPMRERPRGMAMIAGLQSVAYLSGPVMSGALTDSYLTWRFNFWINLPIGFVSFVMVWYLARAKPSPNRKLPFLRKILNADPGGAALLTGSLVCLFLALEWGGAVYPFSAPQVWGCFLGFGLLALAFTGSQIWKKDKAVIPLRLLKQRTIAVCCVFSALYGVAIIVHSTLLPVYFQTVHGISATMSGVYYIPMTIVSVIGIVMTGFSITAWGHYVPFLWAGPLIYMAGSVLFYKLDVNATAAQYLGYQVITGFGFGITIHVSLIAVQVVSSPEDMPTACVTEMFCGQLGGAMGVSIAQNLFVSTLKSRLKEIVSSGEAVAFADGGLENMITAMGRMDNDRREQFRHALNRSITTAFLVPVAVTATAAVVSWFIERRIMDVSKPQVAAVASVEEKERDTDDPGSRPLDADAAPTLETSSGKPHEKTVNTHP